MLSPSAITSPLLSGPRQVWLQRPAAAAAEYCLIFLDAELQIERVQAPQILQRLTSERRLPPVACVYVSAAGAAARHVEQTCNERFSMFLATDLIRWIGSNVGSYERYAICGLSLSGLAAAFAVQRHPHVFDRALCQSPSAWWNEEWLASNVLPPAAKGGRFWISVGDQELDREVSHPPTGLFQRASQRDSCRRLAAALSAAGHAVQFSEFPGGHDPVCWAEELPSALAWVLED